MNADREKVGIERENERVLERQLWDIERDGQKNKEKGRERMILWQRERVKKTGKRKSMFQHLHSFLLSNYVYNIWLSLHNKVHIFLFILLQIFCPYLH